MNILSAEGCLDSKQELLRRYEGLVDALHRSGATSMGGSQSGNQVRMYVTEVDQTPVGPEHIGHLLSAFDDQKIFVHQCSFGIEDQEAERMRSQNQEMHTRYDVVTETQPPNPILRNILYSAATATNNVLSSSVELGKGNILRIRILVRSDAGDVLRQIQFAMGRANVIVSKLEWEHEDLYPFELAQGPSEVSTM